MYILLIPHLCDIIFLNAYIQTEDKRGDVKDSFYEQAVYVFDHFPKYHIKV
jgi:hypothetical protein